MRRVQLVSFAMVPLARTVSRGEKSIAPSIRNIKPGDLSTPPTIFLPGAMAPSPPPLSVKRHTNYFRLCLGLLPPRTQKEDSNKLMILYCTVGGLALLNHKFTKPQRDEIVEFVYAHLVESGEGFRGSATHKIGGQGQMWDCSTVANTYSALCVLLMLDEDFTRRLDSEKVMEYLKKCQLDSGAFVGLCVGDEQVGEADLRTCYMACAIRRMVGYNEGNDIDVEKLVRYIHQQVVYDGGLGTHESHAGHTFCGLAALKLLDRLEPADWEKTVGWLAHRQVSYTEWTKCLLDLDTFDENDEGGHNGRDNKFADTCYSFWCTGSLDLLDKTRIVDTDAMVKYLMNMTQNGVVGGFGKTEEDDPDPYHSFLALSALSLSGQYPELSPLDTTLVIPKRCTEKLKSMHK